MKNLLFVILSVLITWQIVSIQNIISPIIPMIIYQNNPIETVLKELGCPKDRLKEIAKAVEISSEQTNINPYLLSVLMFTESNFNFKAVSNKNYQGLMQTPTATKQWADVDILHGARILQEKLKITKGNMYEALSLYKGGKNHVARTQARNVIVLYQKIIERKG